jgi:homoserine dehydrogenase
MQKTIVLKFGSSVLRSAGDLHVAVDEIYRHWRLGFRVLAVVSAFEDTTDRLMSEVIDTIGTDCPEATAAYVATGEQQTAALLLGSLHQYGLPSRLASPSDIRLVADGSLVESTPVGVDSAAIERLWAADPILVLPGFFGVDTGGRTALFGRGGSDISALFVAAAFGCECRLLKNVSGVFDHDPEQFSTAQRFAALTWDTALAVAGPLIQPKALRYAHDRSLPFEVGRANEIASTHVGVPLDRWAPSMPTSKPLSVALFGCGVVGRGVYEALKRYPQRFDVRHVIVRDIERYGDIERITTDPAVFLDERVDVIVVCFGGVKLAYPLMIAALNAGKFVVTANKAAVAAHGLAIADRARGPERRLWYSAAVGGALPALETLVQLDVPVREIRGTLNGTCGVVLEAWGEGSTRDDAVSLAQAQGFAEADPIRDLSGRDSADKLSLLIHAAFDHKIDPEHIPTRGIDTLGIHPKGVKLIARATRTPTGVTASVGPALLPNESFIGNARGPENRLEIELTSGDLIRLRGQGAGRWPTTVSVIGDLHEIARLKEERGSPKDRT